ncbi:MAG: G8 domain-containing protein [Actinomycetota bacterium]
MKHVTRTGRRAAPATLVFGVVMALVATACVGQSDTASLDGADDPTSTAAVQSSDQTADQPTAPRASTGSEDHSAHGAGGHTAAMALVDPASATHVATSSGSWAAPGTWNAGAAPKAGSRVHIPAGLTVTVDRVETAEIKTIRVDGALRVDPAVDTELRVDTLVTTPGGVLELGTAAAPIAPDVTARITFADDGPIDRQWDPTLVSRGALLHGTTVMHGAEKRAFVPVAEFPAAGDTSVQLADAPTGWQPGDVIVIAGTDPSDPTSDEQRTITAIDGTVVTLDSPLALDHAAPQADLAVHVANLTRNVRITSANTDVSRRGHVMLAHTNDASIDYVWFDGLGRSDKARGYDDLEFIDLNPYIPARVLGGDNVRGRYSLHFHRGGTDRTAAPARVHGSVVSDDPGWAFVNHSSHVEFTDNVAYDIVGAAYYTEAGDEIGSFAGNIAIRIVNPNMPLKGGIDGDEVDPDAREGRQDYGFQGDGMWLHSPNVRVEDNVFSGISGHAVIVWPEGLLERNPDGSTSKVFHDTANVAGGDLIGPAGTPMQIMDVPIPSFRGNQAYSVTRGVQLFYLHTEFFGEGLYYEDCTIDPPAEYDSQLRSTFADSTIWNMDQVGFAAPYTNRITIDGLRIVGDGRSDTVGIDVGHFRNERGIEITDVTVDGTGVGIRISAEAEVTLRGERLSNTTDVQYVIPDEDGAGAVVDGPRTPDFEEPERLNDHLQDCVFGQPPADMDLDAIERGEFDEEDEDIDDEFEDDEFEDEAAE